MTVSSSFEVLVSRPVVYLERELEATTRVTRETEPGVWLRHNAGVRSLADRANLEVEVIDRGVVEEVSHYGDTDQRIQVVVGDDLNGGGYGRLARFEGHLILHRTVGNRPQFHLEGIVVVKSRNSEEMSAFKLHDDEGRLAMRVVEELAARALEA